MSSELLALYNKYNIYRVKNIDKTSMKLCPKDCVALACENEITFKDIPSKIFILIIENFKYVGSKMLSYIPSHISHVLIVTGCINIRRFNLKSFDTKWLITVKLCHTMEKSTQILDFTFRRKINPASINPSNITHTTNSASVSLNLYKIYTHPVEFFMDGGTIHDVKSYVPDYFFWTMGKSPIGYNIEETNNRHTFSLPSQIGSLYEQTIEYHEDMLEDLKSRKSLLCQNFVKRMTSFLRPKSDIISNSEDIIGETFIKEPEWFIELLS